MLRLLHLQNGVRGHMSTSGHNQDVRVLQVRDVTFLAVGCLEAHLTLPFKVES